MLATLRRLNQHYWPSRCLLPPKWIVLGVNNVCNLRCKMCDVGTGDVDTTFAQNLIGTRPLNMPLELIRRIIEQTAREFPQTKLGYAFTEPLVYPHLTESLRLARDVDLYTAVTTNALTLKAKARELVDAGLNELNISLDGPPDIHNAIRGHARSYERAIEGIESLLALASRPKISVYCVITQWNIGHLERFAAALACYPLARLGFLHYVMTTATTADRHNAIWGARYRATQSNDRHRTPLSEAQLTTLWNELCALKAARYPFALAFSPDMPTPERLRSFYCSEEKFGRRCGDVYATLMIKSDGSAIPAHGRCYNLTVGNVYRETLREIWNAPLLNEFRTDLHKAGGLLPACTRCCSAFHR